MVNRPGSDGRFSALNAAESNALGADDTARSERAYSLGIKFIREHPLDFMSIVLRKPFYLYGEDVKNIYWNLDHQHGEPDTVDGHAVAYWLSNGFYLSIVLLITVIVMRRRYLQDATPLLILPWMFTLYPIFAHSLFEGAERHRYGALPFIAIFAGMALAGSGKNRDADRFVGL